MLYGIFFGKRKRETERVLNILLRACECARAWSVQKVRTEAGKQEIFHKRERQKREKSTGMAGKNMAGACTKQAEKTLRKPKIPVWLEKTRQAASVKCERFQMKIGITGEKHGRHLHKSDRKKRFGNPKMPEWLIKNSKWHPQNAKDSG